MITYKGGYKYQLQDEYVIQIAITVPKDIKTKYLELTTDGVLTIKKGYAWDGASGPTIDTKSSMRGSLVHDALYQLMRERLITSEYRLKADDYLHDICTEDGMINVRADYWRLAVQWFSQTAIEPGYGKQIETAP